MWVCKKCGKEVRCDITKKVRYNSAEIPKNVDDIDNNIKNCCRSLGWIYNFRCTQCWNNSRFLEDIAEWKDDK